MASSNLLKEAIADAKAVRETAIANAKLALEEAFTPRLQSMLSNKIEEELEDDNDEETEMKEQSDSSQIGKGDNKVDIADGDDEEKAETEKQSSAYGLEQDAKVVNKLTEVEDEEEVEEMDMDSEEDETSEEDEEMDMELEAIIKELEGEDEETEMEDEEKTEMEDQPEMAETEMEDDETSEEDEEMDEELNIESILSALKEEDEEEATEEEEEEETEMYKEQLEEAYNTIKSLKSTLNEVNLLNAKLLFSTKLFKSQNLTESQKMRVIETFDRAQSLREVKLVYTTLAEGMNPSVKATKKLRTEGLASKAQKTTKPTQVIAEGNLMASRMKKLAGLL